MKIYMTIHISDERKKAVKCSVLSGWKTWLYNRGAFINIFGNHWKFYNFEHFFQSSVSNRKKIIDILYIDLYRKNVKINHLQ